MNEIVKYENYMNSLKFTGFTTTDFNFLMALCSRMRDKETKKIIFSFSELRSITDYKKSNSVKQFVSDLEKMNEKLMKVTCKLRTETKIIMFVLFPTFEIDFEDQTLTVAVNESFKFILNELIKNFTRFDLKEFVALESRHSKTLYRLLKQFKTTGIFEIKLDDFRKKMDCPVSYSNKYVMDKLIKPSLKELQSYFTDLQCTVKYAHKRGRPVEGYIFTFKPEETPKPAPKKLSTETPATTYKASKPKESLSQEEKNKLINEFGEAVADYYITKSSQYNNCYNYSTIRQWILEDKQKQNVKVKSTNKFNQFMQRDITQEELDALEKRILNRSANGAIEL